MAWLVWKLEWIKRNPSLVMMTPNLYNSLYTTESYRAKQNSANLGVKLPPTEVLLKTLPTTPKVRGAFVQLNTIWSSKSISVSTKFRIFNSSTFIRLWILVLNKNVYTDTAVLCKLMFTKNLMILWWSRVISNQDLLKKAQLTTHRDNQQTYTIWISRAYTMQCTWYTSTMSTWKTFILIGIV